MPAESFGKAPGLFAAETGFPTQRLLELIDKVSLIIEKAAVEEFWIGEPVGEQWDATALTASMTAMP